MGSGGKGTKMPPDHEVGWNPWNHMQRHLNPKFLDFSIEKGLKGADSLRTSVWG